MESSKRVRSHPGSNLEAVCGGGKGSCYLKIITGGATTPADGGPNRRRTVRIAIDTVDIFKGLLVVAEPRIISN